MKGFFSKIFSKKNKSQSDSESYMYSDEFHEAIQKAVKKGAEDQAKFMKSVGMKWDEMGVNKRRLQKIL